jgi:hypothetical protein
VTLNRSQRVVLLVAIGVVVAVATVALTHEWDQGRPVGGWFSYAPNTSVTFGSDGSSWPIWRDALAWFFAAAIWCAAGLYLLRTTEAIDEPHAVGSSGPSRRSLGTTLGWVVVAFQIALGVAFGWLWWVVAACTTAGLLLTRRPHPHPREEP